MRFAPVCCLMGLLALATCARAESTPVAARDGVALAAAAARAWAEDASLVYVENDDAIGASGASPRWGYLYSSPTRAICRVYSIENGSIEVAEDLALRFSAPALPESWIDSPAALAAAEREEGAKFRAEQGGSLSTMALIRSAFREDRPDATYWLVVYEASGAPSLFVLVDAASGNVARSWRG